MSWFSFTTLGRPLLFIFLFIFCHFQPCLSGFHLLALLSLRSPPTPGSIQSFFHFQVIPSQACSPLHCFLCAAIPYSVVHFIPGTFFQVNCFWPPLLPSIKSCWSIIVQVGNGEKTHRDCTESTFTSPVIFRRSQFLFVFPNHACSPSLSSLASPGRH